MCPDFLVQLGLRRIDRRGDEAGRIAAQVQRDPAVARAERAAARPNDLAHRYQLIEQARSVVADARGDDVTLDHAGRQGQTLELEDDLQEAVDSTRAHRDAVPGR